MEWILDQDKSLVEFTIKKFWGLVTVRGGMEVRQARLELDGSDPTRWSAYVELDPATLSTRNARRDAHLRSPDFFDVTRYPIITFRSQTVEPSGDTALRLRGELTIRNITQPVTLEVSRHTGSAEGELYFEATTTISRHNFGLSYNRPPISREAVINLKVKAVQLNSVLNESSSGY